MKTLFDRKRLLRSGIVAAAAVTTFTTLAVTTPSGAEKSSKAVEVHEGAGVSSLLTEMEAGKKETGSLESVSERTVAAAAAASDQAEIGGIEEKAEDPWEDRLMANVQDSANVRAEASETSALAGKLRRGDVAEILSTENGWYQIRSGNLTGYIRSDLALTGEAAKDLSAQLNPEKASVTADALRIRSSADEAASVLATVYKGADLTVREAEAPAGWTPVTINNKEGFVKTSFVTVASVLPTGITSEEEAAMIAAEKKAKAAAAEKKAGSKAPAPSAGKTTSSASTGNHAINTSANDQTLIAAIIQLEAGHEPYEGQVAVGAVIMNRLKNGRWPNTVQGVVFQRNQFYPAGSSRLARVLSKGPSASCMQAAADAMAGSDPTGGCMSFRSARTGRSGLRIGNQIFF